MPTTTKRADTKNQNARTRRARKTRAIPKGEPVAEDESNFIITVTERRSGRAVPFQEAMQRLGYVRLTEDEADFIIGERLMRKEAHKAVPLEEVLKEYGRTPRRRLAS